MTKPTCDNDCTRMGWVEYEVSDGMVDLHVSVAPDADLDGTVRAFWHDMQEMVTLRGWLAIWERIENAECD